MLFGLQSGAAGAFLEVSMRVLGSANRNKRLLIDADSNFPEKDEVLNRQLHPTFTPGYGYHNNLIQFSPLFDCVSLNIVSARLPSVFHKPIAVGPSPDQLMCSPNGQTRIKMKFEKFDSRKQIRSLAESCIRLQRRQSQLSPFSEAIQKRLKRPTLQNHYAS